MSTLIRAQISRHSQKPKEFWARAERLKEAIAINQGHCSAIELFSRQARDGWDAWGNEVNQNQEDVA